MLIRSSTAWVDSEEGTGGLNPPGKSQVAVICFLRCTGMDLSQEAIGPFGPTAS